MKKTNFPDIEPQDDPDLFSGYTAGVKYDSVEQPIRFPGSFSSFSAARTKAGLLTAALVLAGETGVAGHVGFTGKKPPGFPVNGVSIPAWSPERPMLPENFDTPVAGRDLAIIAKQIHGQKYGSRQALAELTGASPKTLDRQMAADIVDPTLSRLIRCLQHLRIPRKKTPASTSATRAETAPQLS